MEAQADGSVEENRQVIVVSADRLGFSIAFFVVTSLAIVGVVLGAYLHAVACARNGKRLLMVSAVLLAVIVFLTFGPMGPYLVPAAIAAIVTAVNANRMPIRANAEPRERGPQRRAHRIRIP